MVDILHLTTYQLSSCIVSYSRDRYDTSAMNTCSWKCQFLHPANQLKEENLLLDMGNFFTLPNMLDDHTYVHIIQQDTCLYDIQDLEPEDIAERMQIKKQQTDKRRMRRIRQVAEIQGSKVKRLRRELQMVHKKE